MKDIVQELTDIKLKYVTDLNLTSTASNLDSTITVALASMYDNILTDRVITITETTTNTIIFSGTVLSNTPSDINTNVVITLSGTINTSTITTVVDPVNCTVSILKDLTLETACTSAINAFNTANPNTLTNNDYITYNSTVLNFSDFVGSIITYKDSYQIASAIDTYIGIWFDILSVDLYTLTSVSTPTLLDQINLLNSINIDHDTINSDLLAYFSRIKKLMPVLTIVDMKIKNEAYTNLYNAKSATDQANIDLWYQYYLDNGIVSYAEYKSTIMHGIKI